MAINKSGMSSEIKQRYSELKTQEKLGEITEAGRMELQDLRDRFEK